MCKYVIRSITIPADQYDLAHEIIDKYYIRGDIESIHVCNQPLDYTYEIAMGCSTDDFEAIMKELQDNQIKLL